MSSSSKKIKNNVALASLTTFKIGGNAKYFAEANTKEELISLLKWAKTRFLPIFILGGGSNVLISDDGFDGLVIKNSTSFIAVEGDAIYADAGASLGKIVTKSLENNLSGFEWAVGIPGTIGGAIKGNAGAFDSEIKDLIEFVEVFNSKKSKRFTLNAKRCEFKYRDSIFKHSPDLIIISAKIFLQSGDVNTSRDIVRKYSKKRTEDQDIGTKCAGCVFKNVLWNRKDIDKGMLINKFSELGQFENSPHIPAGFLIDSLGLKGRQIDGAIVSNKHANYIVNLNNAKAKDIIKVINFIKEKILKHYGILLEEEVQLIGL